MVRHLLKRVDLIQLQRKAAKAFAGFETEQLPALVELLENLVAIGDKRTRDIFESFERGATGIESHYTVDEIFSTSLVEMPDEDATLLALALLPVLKAKLGLLPPTAPAKVVSPRLSHYRPMLTSRHHVKPYQEQQIYIPSGCLVCDNLRGVLDTYFPVAMYQDSSRNGCQPCTMLLEAIESFKPGWVNSNNNVQRSVKLKVYSRSSWFNVMLQESRTDAGSFKLLRPYGNPKDWEVSALERPELISDTSSDATFTKVKKWLTTCLKNHANCKTLDPEFVDRKSVV